MTKAAELCQESCDYQGRSDEQGRFELPKTAFKTINNAEIVIKIKILCKSNFYALLIVNRHVQYQPHGKSRTKLQSQTELGRHLSPENTQALKEQV